MSTDSTTTTTTTTTTGGGDVDGDGGLEVDDRLYAVDLTEDPRLDSEVLCLCGLLWSMPVAARRVGDLLQAEDFHPSRPWRLVRGDHHPAAAWAPA